MGERGHAELEAKLLEIEARRRKAEENWKEVDRQREQLHQYCSNLEAEKVKAEGRADAANSTALECSRRLEALEHKRKLEADLKVEQLQQTAAALDVQRHSEILSARLDLLTLSKHQRMASALLRHTQASPASSQ